MAPKAKKDKVVRMASKESTYKYVTTKTGEKKLKLMKFAPDLNKRVLFTEEDKKK